MDSGGIGSNDKAMSDKDALWSTEHSTSACAVGAADFVKLAMCASALTTRLSNGTLMRVLRGFGGCNSLTELRLRVQVFAHLCPTPSHR